MHVWYFAFSFRGRIGRGDFWLLFAGGVVLWLVASVIATFVAVVFWFAGTVILLSAAARRLHDRDKSALYLFLFFGVPSFLNMWLSRDRPSGELRIVVFSGGTGSVLDFLCLAISIWMIVELGCMHGSIGPNQYGADPNGVTEPESV
jgi:uncharacterized membrane protein YhaH (DUF805 family)